SIRFSILHSSPVSTMIGADDLIALLDLSPHPEGGWFRETWRDPAGAGTAIYFLLRSGERSHWHRLAQAEGWHFYARDPLALGVADGSGRTTHTLGADVAEGQRPQAVVPAGAWQSARPLGRWTLAGCTVSPAFDFAGFELAPAGWEPSGSPGSE